MDDAFLLLDRVTVRGRERPVLDRLSLTLARGQTLALLGPESAGKTAALLALAGFLRLAEGTIRLAGRDITAAPPHRRDIGFVPREDTLFPHISVLDNVAFGLKMRRVPRAGRRARAAATLAALGLAPLAARHPARLDAIARRQLAFARAVAPRPALLLLDEPDAPAQAEAIHDALRAACRAEPLTTVLATRDRAAAFGLAARVALLRAGRLEQLGTPQELFEHPANRFVAGFTGPCNLLAATLLGTTGAGAVIKLARGTANAQPRPDLVPGKVLVCLRPHRLRPQPDGPVRGPVEDVAYQGAMTRVTLRLPEGPLVADLAQAPPGLARGTELALGWNTADAWLLPAEA